MSLRKLKKVNSSKLFLHPKFVLCEATKIRRTVSVEDTEPEWSNENAVYVRH
jgi:hypothetical protein